MTFQEFKEAVISKAKEFGLTEYELYYQEAESTSVSAFQHEINEFTSSIDGGVCFRAIVNGKMGYASTQELSLGEAKAIVEQAVDNASVLETEETVFLGEGGQEYEALELRTQALPATDALIRTVLDTQDKLYKADPAVIDGTATQGFAERSQIAIFNSKGLDVRYENNLCGLMAEAVVSDGTEMSNDYQMKLGSLDEIDTDRLTKKAVDGALEKMGGEVPATGVYPIVFSAGAMSDLLATFSSVFSSENAQKGLSKLGDKEGKIIASPAVTLVDDPFYGESPMPINFDAEGSPTHRKNIIENGTLRTLLYNLKTAAVAGKKTTGNASKAGYDAPVGIRPFTMYLAPGEYSEEELFQKAENGVYINSLQGLHAGANAVSGDFSLQSAGFLIENGRKTTHVKSFTVAGNFYEVLTKITAVGDKVELPMATGMTAFGSPGVLVETLSVAGK